MEFDRILIRYGELSTKGKNRKQFVTRLAHNVKRAMKDLPEVRIHGERDRMYIILNGEDHKLAEERLKPIFGIQSFSPAVRVNLELDEVKKAALGLVQDVHEQNGTFKVAARRSHREFPLDSNEINQEIGAYVLQNIEDLSVNVKNPDVKLTIDVRKEGVFLSCRTIIGAAGLPVGSSGRAMLMLSGGIDSPVAGYLAQKRGVEIEAVHFHSPPYTSEQAKQKAVDLAAKLAKYGGEVKMHIVPFTEIQEMIKQQIPESVIMTVTRRMMLKITDELRRKRNGLAIVNGESLGQVASQTLESMLAINAVTTTPIIRPVVSMDKNEIIQIAQKIDTYNLSVQPFEDCCTIFTPPSPKTKPKLDKIERYESFTDFDSLITKALDNIETITVNITENAQVKDEFADLF
ncbi:tRNA uracil 4-sulfurtransferase ThiI [Listeria welshimeri]|uniref:Probable tRNA sulfurtransferase n=1 Tax=Listeria welshimeri TaxID=1643 RepID=A0A7X0T7Q8_LISWE|nr:tRNA uracil 4-sulfurtransferase ThiI [Listeria welshimeri]MBC1287482.1 tRNA 4-thiouridine(8) synthase ThiI [Listeria welshimeri]MBC1321240.1 tRNA 4-thiouridine(8) synthase ThiI [Listeria welshimeri]MBC1324130.1 tRNA 4-thiouridine(8) synthase ThiI [Listeria welshimeri]MBC1476874.1 tRNA 4-thiouridine(8) synthase ThiI [Listeria welshimeri]MBC2359162.1 tRNA 4-thiouridine(8) synthase ThiI [Listeria welshimeri]